MDKEENSAYLPSLDGWRAIAILSVMLYHSMTLRVGIFSTAWAWRYGFRGVDIFFAISGLLITTRLLREEERSSRISLRRFYLRRVFRILPPALVYLTSIALLTVAHWIHVSRAEWLAALFFLRNYSFTFQSRTYYLPWFTTHFWSLSLEEHFYLLLPALLLWTRGRVRIAALAGVSACVVVHRYFELLQRDWSTIQFHTGVRLDALFLPALFAVLSCSGVYGPQFNRFIRRFHFLFAVALLLFVWLPEGSALQATGVAFTMPGVVLGTVLKRKSLATRLLEWNPLRWIGRISYSLYLWQQLFFSQRFLGLPLGRLEAWPLNLLLTFLVATLSYYAVERPLVQLGHKLSARRSDGVAAIAGARL